MRVVVVGAGIVGAVTGWRAAEAGHQVTVVDDGGPGAWQVAAGMLAPALEAAAGEDDLLALALAAAARWPTFAADLQTAADADIAYARDGALLVARDQDDLALLREVLAVHRDLGLQVTPLRSRECRAREPALHPAIRGGLHAPDDHRVDPRRVVAAARAAGSRAGMAVVGGQVRSVTRSDGRASGVELTDGTHLAADTVVVAAGWRSGSLDGCDDLEVPALRPVKGQLLVLAAADGRPPLTTTVRGRVHGRPVYLVPRDDGRVVVGATSEERGADTSVTAGAVRTLLDDAVALVPGVDELELRETLAGLRPGTADGRPLVGRTEVEGLVLATGHHRNGVLLAPLTADAVVATLAGDDPGPTWACADPRRGRHRPQGTSERPEVTTCG